MDSFFHCLSSFSGVCFQSNPHRNELFLIIRNTRLHISSIYGLLHFSRTAQDSIDATDFKSFNFSSVHIRTSELSYSKKDMYQSVL